MRSRKLNRAEKDRTATPSSKRRVDGVPVIQQWRRRAAVAGLIYALCLTLPKVPSPSVRPISYLPTCFLAAIVQRDGCRNGTLAGGRQILRGRRSQELRAPLGELARVANKLVEMLRASRVEQRVFGRGALISPWASGL